MRIGIIGLGYVGLTLGIAAADKGIEVHGIEVNEHIKECLRDNKAHFYEPGLNNMIKRYNNKRFFATDSFSADMDYDAFIITVGTPLRDGEKLPNFEYIKSALLSIKDIYDGSQLIVLRSTVSVGTTRNVVLPYLAGLCGKSRKDILVGMCPERTLEGKAVDELTHLPQIISGNNNESIRKAYDLFSRITPCIVEAESLEEAELIKLYCNTYRDMTFAIGNAFCMAAQNYGVDGIKVIEHANYGYARSNIAKPGFVAGPCLEKDAYILINNMPQCDSKDFILSARKFNESLEDIVVKWVESKIGKADGKKVIAVSGLAFKGQPETSDLRGSSSVYIARKLKKAGYRMNIHDFCALPDEMRGLDLGDYYEDIYDACADASLLLILNNHRKYATLLGHPVFKNAKERPFEILDSWGVCTELYYDEEIKISTLGNMNIGEEIGR